MALAEKKGVALSKNEPKIDTINGTDFDKEYLAIMVKDHEKNIAAFEEEAKDGEDADVKAWAEKTLPTLKEHLKMVQDAPKQDEVIPNLTGTCKRSTSKACRAFFVNRSPLE
jgi:predicted outer membrane protein